MCLNTVHVALSRAGVGGALWPGCLCLDPSRCWTAVGVTGGKAFGEDTSLDLNALRQGRGRPARE
jgi:hypothetical protein